MAHKLRSIFASIAGILLCGIAGGYCGWRLVDLLGLDGILAAVVGAIVGMVVATAAWLGLTCLLRKLGVVT